MYKIIGTIERRFDFGPADNPWIALLVNVDLEHTSIVTERTVEQMEPHLDRVWRSKSKFDPVDRREVMLIELYGKAIRDDGKVFSRFITTGKGDHVTVNHRLANVFNIVGAFDQRLIEAFEVSPRTAAEHRRSPIE